MGDNSLGSLCFAILDAVTEVNMYLCMRYFVWDGNEKMTLLEFRRALAWELINNPDMVEKEEKLRRSKRRRDKVAEHALGTAPRFARRWNGIKWEVGSKKPTSNTNGLFIIAPPEFGHTVIVIPVCGCVVAIGVSTMQRSC